MVFRRTCLLALLSVIGCASGVFADDVFRTRVAPILESRCLSCHNDDDKKGDFSLQTRQALKESGFVEASDPDGSHLLEAITSAAGERPSMPKDGDPLSSGEVEIIRDWIAVGAQWPDGVELRMPVVDNFDWWSLRPIASASVPTFDDAASQAWVRSPIDAFVLRKLKNRGLVNSPPADRRTLIRRLTYDLTGLPPTPQQVEAFVADDSPDAYEQLVDRLLSSKHYGERWARHWLDVVRYADTCGYDKDKLRPNAWPYRDYVVRSFNDDKPYSRFVEEQIAGDVLYPGTPDGVLGLGFIAAGPWDFIGHVEVPESKIDGMEARNLDRDEMVSGTLNTFCSATVQCARCHNHKFDPITQEHYYSLQSVFAGVDRAERVFDVNADAEQQRNRLLARLAKLGAERRAMDEALQVAAGPRLSALDKKIKRLAGLPNTATKRPEFGYHSAIEKNEDSVKSVHVELGREFEVAEVVLHPCHDDFAGIGAGFGFPKRFSVVTFAPGSTEPIVIADRSTADFPNPRLEPVRIKLPKPIRASKVKVIAKRLAPRSNDFIFALAELEVLDTAGRNVARGATVGAKDSIEAPVRWRRQNLVDGIWPEASSAEQELSRLEAARLALIEPLKTPEWIRRSDSVRDDIAKARAELTALPRGRVVYAAATDFKAEGNFKPTRGQPRRVRLLHRGNIQQPRGDVQPGAIPLDFDSRWQFDLGQDHTEGERRAALAKWITDKDNPLTWRSIVNRIWQYHFGRGIVETPNDFGRMGQSPTHPELLDWLAVEFRDKGQRFRPLHRMIVLSSTYRQASTPNSNNTAIDGDNRLLWRMNRRRLEAEELRDAVLSVSGVLNPQMGGPGYYLFKLEKTEHSPHYEYHLFDPEDKRSHRRSLYRFVVRSQPDPFMTTLDCADSSQSTPRRVETLTSLQALSLLNNRFMLSMSQHFARRLEREAVTPDERIRLGMQLVANREPTSSEVRRLKAYAAEHGLPNLCRVLLNLSEFVYVD